MAAQICLAAPIRDVPRDDIAIGGIQFGASYEYVRSIYGEPDRVLIENGKEYEPRLLSHWYYGDSFTVTFDEDRGTVYKIKSNGRNGLKIPLGVAVGNNIYTVEEHYGNQCYFVSDNNGYTLRLQSGGIYMLIKATPDAEITEISIYPGI